jgi:hypothetical protein
MTAMHEKQPAAVQASHNSFYLLEARRSELKAAIERLLTCLMPEANRRGGQRRSGRDRRAAHSTHPERRRGERRAHTERRLPFFLRLRLLRIELQEVLRRQEELRRWQNRQLRA